MEVSGNTAGRRRGWRSICRRRPIPGGAVEGNIPPAHICGHMDQDDSPAGTRVHLGGSSHKRHDESQGRSLPPQEHPISRMVVGAMQQGHNIAVCP